MVKFLGMEVIRIFGDSFIAIDLRSQDVSVGTKPWKGSADTQFKKTLT